MGCQRRRLRGICCSCSRLGSVPFPLGRHCPCYPNPTSPRWGRLRGLRRCRLPVGRYDSIDRLEDHQPALARCLDARLSGRDGGEQSALRGGSSEADADLRRGKRACGSSAHSLNIPNAPPPNPPFTLPYLSHCHSFHTAAPLTLPYKSK